MWLENPSSSPIPVVDSDFLVEEVDTFPVSEDSIPPSIESDLDSEGDIVFLNEDPIPAYERFTFNIDPDAPVLNNFDELNEDECFDPEGVKTSFLTPTSPLRAGGISSGWNFHDCPDFEDSRVHGFVHSYIRASNPQLHLGNPIS
ncbi:hypothetical protein Tco_1219124 [Tanacetum coccineum]